MKLTQSQQRLRTQARQVAVAVLGARVPHGDAGVGLDKRDLVRRKKPRRSIRDIIDRVARVLDASLGVIFRDAGNAGLSDLAKAILLCLCLMVEGLPEEGSILQVFSLLLSAFRCLLSRANRSVLQERIFGRGSWRMSSTSTFIFARHVILWTTFERQ